ncbi:hypothetical protein ACTJKN_00755 [Pedobacter sp. 22163]|uniref:hypothetical protein n=1 Tax=Pedobacter sp. 22163 TaxID=3453883 RepID=UPI003F869824
MKRKNTILFLLLEELTTDKRMNTDKEIEKTIITYKGFILNLFQDLIYDAKKNTD